MERVFYSQRKVIDNLFLHKLSTYSDIILYLYSMIVYDEAVNALRRIAKVQNKKC